MQDFIIERGELKKYTGKGGDIVIPDGVRAIGDMAFWNNETVTSVTVGGGVKEIMSHAFDGCKNLSRVELCEGIEIIGPWAFSACGSLKYIKIPASVTELTYEVFLDSTALEAIDVDENNAVYRSIDGNLYSKDGTVFYEYAAGKTDKEFFIPQSVREMAEKALFHCNHLERVVAPKMKEVKKWTFFACNGLKTIEFVDGLERIERVEIDLCPSLENILLPNSVRDISHFRVRNCDALERLIFPDGLMKLYFYNVANCPNFLFLRFNDGVLSVDEGAIANCPKLTEICVPFTASAFTGLEFFAPCAVEEIKVDDGNARYRSIDGNLYDITGETLVLYAAGKASGRFVVPSSVKKIGAHAFSAAENLKEIFIPLGVETVEENAFADCKNAILFAEADKKPDGWIEEGEEGTWEEKKWNPKNLRVHWGFDMGKL